MQNDLISLLYVAQRKYCASRMNVPLSNKKRIQIDVNITLYGICVIWNKLHQNWVLKEATFLNHTEFVIIVRFVQLKTDSLTLRTYTYCSRSFKNLRDKLRNSLLL